MLTLLTKKSVWVKDVSPFKFMMAAELKFYGVTFTKYFYN